MAWKRKQTRLSGMDKESDQYVLIKNDFYNPAFSLSQLEKKYNITRVTLYKHFDKEKRNEIMESAKRRKGVKRSKATDKIPSLKHFDDSDISKETIKEGAMLVLAKCVKRMDDCINTSDDLTIKELSEITNRIKTVYEAMSEKTDVKAHVNLAVLVNSAKQEAKKLPVEDIRAIEYEIRGEYSEL